MPNQDQVDQAMQRDLGSGRHPLTFETLSDGNVFTTTPQRGPGRADAQLQLGLVLGLRRRRHPTGTCCTATRSSPTTTTTSSTRCWTRRAASLDPDERMEIYSKAQRIIRDEAPMIFMWGFHSVWGVSNNVEWSPRPDEIDSTSPPSRRRRHVQPGRSVDRCSAPGCALLARRLEPGVRQEVRACGFVYRTPRDPDRHRCLWHLGHRVRDHEHDRRSGQRPAAAGDAARAT